ASGLRARNCNHVENTTGRAHLYRTTGRANTRARMAVPTTSKRERILHQGLALMSQSGLGGVTLGVLADQVGMSKSGLFAHFRSKETVQVELLTHMAEFARARVVDPAMTARDGLPRLRELVRNWFGWARRA